MLQFVIQCDDHGDIIMAIKIHDNVGISITRNELASLAHSF